MKAFVFFPSLEMHAFLSKIVYLENEEEEFSFQSIPRNYPAIFFVSPKSGSLDIYIGQNYFQLKENHVYFAGLGFHPSQMKFNAQAKMWVLMLQPQVAEMFFGDAAKAFVNQICCVTDTHYHWRWLAEQLWEQPKSLVESIRFLEKRIAQQLKSPKIKPSVSLALHHIYNANGVLSINDLAKNTYTCNRNLLRQFNESIGVNPKTFSDMIRFSKLMEQLMQRPVSNLDVLAFQLGYYDLSHLNKDFIRFLGSVLYGLSDKEKSLNQHWV